MSNGGGLLLFWILEGVVPLVRMQYHRVRHAGLNLFFTLTTVVVNFLFASLIILAADYSSRHHTGLLYLFPMPLWLFTLLGLMILDLIGAWLIHWLHHRMGQLLGMPFQRYRPPTTGLSASVGDAKIGLDGAD